MAMATRAGLLLAILLAAGCADTSKTPANAAPITAEVASEPEGLESASANGAASELGELPPGDGAEVANAGTPGQPIGDFAITAPSGLASSQPTVRWQAATAATAYEVAIVAEADCAGAEYRSAGNALALTLDPLPEGNHFICLRARNANESRQATNSPMAIQVFHGARSMPTSGAPAARYWHTTVWTGARMIVFGSAVNVPALGHTGASYDPVEQRWTPIANAPQGRWFHEAVWTGQEMLVWGGLVANADGQGASYGTSGLRYNPKTDSWTRMSATGAPAGRDYHSLIWAGGRMLVWGGRSPGVTNTGAIYDPERDAWQTMAPAPVGAYWHTASWTGQEMIIYGGVRASNAPVGGFAYDPKNDRWRRISSAGAPAYVTGQGIRHTAAWIGSELIVMTGSASAAYDPKTDSWRQLAPGGPGTLLHARSLWNGREVGLLTLSGSPAPQANLFLYDPMGDRWRSVPTAGAPSPRAPLSIQWSGEAFLHWGGSTFLAIGAANTGAEVYP